MTISLKHQKVSSKGDGVDDTLIQPSDWNEEHTLTLAAARLVGRYSSGAGAAEEVSVGTGLQLTGAGVLQTNSIPDASLSNSYTNIADIKISGRFQIGGATSDTAYGTPATVIYKSGTDARIVVGQYGNNSNVPSVVVAKTKGATIGAHANVQTNDVLGEYLVWADDNASFQAVGSRIRTTATENWTSVAHGSKLTIGVNDKGANTPTDRITVEGADGSTEAKVTLNADVAGVKDLGMTDTLRVGYPTGDLSDGSTTPTVQVQANGASVGVVNWSTSNPGIVTVGRVGNATVGGTLTAVGSSDEIGRVVFSGSTGAAMTGGAKIYAQTTQAWTGSATGTRLYLQVKSNGTAVGDNYTSGLMIDQDGMTYAQNGLTVTNGQYLKTGNQNSETILNELTGAGKRAAHILSDGRLHMVWDTTAYPVIINKTNSASAGNGYIAFNRAGSLKSGLGLNVTDNFVYTSFLGGHWSQFYVNSKPDILIGTIVSTVDDTADYLVAEWNENGVQHRKDYSGPGKPGDVVKVRGYAATLVEDNRGHEHLVKFRVSNVAGDRAVYGVFMGWEDDGDATIGSVGAFKVRIGAGVTVKRGDLIESDGNGCGRVQADDIIRSSTVGKVTAAVTLDTYPDGSYLVPCVLYCG